jgi:hypothetical protein
MFGGLDYKRHQKINKVAEDVAEIKGALGIGKSYYDPRRRDRD